MAVAVDVRADDRSHHQVGNVEGAQLPDHRSRSSPLPLARTDSYWSSDNQYPRSAQPSGRGRCWDQMNARPMDVISPAACFNPMALSLMPDLRGDDAWPIPLFLPILALGMITAIIIFWPSH